MIVLPNATPPPERFSERLGGALHRVLLGVFELVGVPLLLSSFVASGYSSVELLALPTWGERLGVVIASAVSFLAMALGVADLIGAAMVLLGRSWREWGTAPLVLGLFSRSGWRGRSLVFGALLVAIATPLLATEKNQDAVGLLVHPPFRSDLPVEMRNWAPRNDVRIDERPIGLGIVPTGDDPQIEFLGPIPASHHPGPFAVAIDLEQPIDCYLPDLQIFWKRGAGEWSEEASARTPMDCGRRIYRFSIPMGASLERLRVDPGGGVGEFVLHSVSVTAAR
jgi:hypothetical protein